MVTACNTHFSGYFAAGRPHAVPGARVLCTRCHWAWRQLGGINGQWSRQQPGSVACRFATQYRFLFFFPYNPVRLLLHSSKDHMMPFACCLQASTASTATAACVTCCASFATSTTTSGETCPSRGAWPQWLHNRGWLCNKRLPCARTTWQGAAARFAEEGWAPAGWFPAVFHEQVGRAW